MNKHLKRMILAMLTLVMVLSCLPVFSAFATTDPTVDPTVETTPAPTTVAPALDVSNPGVAVNPGITAQQGPLPADYTWLIVLAVVLVALGLIALVIYLKISKKKKKKAQLNQQ